jgi:SAM-dependent methyltransferase
MSRTEADIPWYARWFGEEYLRLYPHRDQEEADRGVDLFLRHHRSRQGSRILDLACGAGRHMSAFRKAGVPAVGLDLSAPLLRRAMESLGAAPLVRGDMRSLPFSDGAFAAVTSFFTSFGYFSSKGEDRRVLQEIHRVLRPPGLLMLDFFNADRVRAELTPRDERTGPDGRRIIQERRLADGGGRVEKTIRIEDPASGAVQTFRERVRLYSSGELEELLTEGGFQLQQKYGDYDGGLPSESSPRIILLAHRARMDQRGGAIA